MTNEQLSIAPYAAMPLLTEVPSSKSKRETDQQTDMCNPTDAIASKNDSKIVNIILVLFNRILLYRIPHLETVLHLQLTLDNASKNALF